MFNRHEAIGNRVSVWGRQRSQFSSRPQQCTTLVAQLYTRQLHGSSPPLSVPNGPLSAITPDFGTLPLSTLSG